MIKVQLTAWGAKKKWNNTVWKTEKNPRSGEALYLVGEM